MKTVEIENINYEIVKNYRDGYNEEVFKERYTDYFKDYDYIVGDWAYGKLRLKGFYNKENKKCREINCIDDLDKYLKENCAYECTYFVAKKI